MEHKIYVIVRKYEHDDTSILCFKDKEKAKADAIQIAKEEHEYFEFEKYEEVKFEDCCYDNKDGIYIDGSTVIWGYQCENVSIELLETILKDPTEVKS